MVISLFLLFDMTTECVVAFLLLSATLLLLFFHADAVLRSRQDLLHQLRGRGADVQADTGFVVLQRFEITQLTVQ